MAYYYNFTQKSPSSLSRFTMRMSITFDTENHYYTDCNNRSDNTNVLPAANKNHSVNNARLIIAVLRTLTLKIADHEINRIIIRGQHTSSKLQRLFASVPTSFPWSLSSRVTSRDKTHTYFQHRYNLNFPVTIVYKQHGFISKTSHFFTAKIGYVPDFFFYTK